jgi:hypothetical protein
MLQWEETRDDIRDEDRRKARLARMLDIEDEVFQTAAGILKANLDFHQVGPTQMEPPPEWIERYGREAALQRLAVARAGWMPQSLAPSAVKLASQVVVGIGRARRHQAAQLGPTEINVKLQLPAPTSADQPGAPEYPSKEIE